MQQTPIEFTLFTSTQQKHPISSTLMSAAVSFLKDERQSVTGTEATVGDVRKDLVVLELTWSLETAAMMNHLSTWS